jgi:hypothetical protein
MTGFRVPIICRSATLGKPAKPRTDPVGRIDPPHEARARLLGGFRLISVAHGHTSADGLPSMVARDAHAGSGGERGRRSAISRRILANSVLATATSAIWKARATELELQPAVEIEPQRALDRFTRRVRHDGSARCRLTC